MDTKKLRQKILDLAIRGKLVPQDPNDEPASVLLERIRAEKERLIKEGKIKRSKKSTSDTPHYENDVPFEVPESWEWCKLIDVCHIFGRIGFRGYTKDDFVSNDGAITLSPSNIIDGQMNYDNCSYISWEKYEESPEIQIANEDILLVKTGSSFGKCAYVCNLPQKATINPQFVVLKYILCNPVFLTYMLQSGYARRNYDEFVLGTAIPTFTQAALGNMYIPLPSKQEQQRIVNAIGQWFKFIDDLEKEQNGLQRLFQLTKSKILDLAIHGKLVPQDPNDEPAIELLKRINPSFVPCDNGHYENVPDNWVLCKVKDVFRINPKTKANDSINAGFVPMANIQDSFKNSISFLTRTWGSIKKGYTHFENGDIVVAKISPCLENRKSAVMAGLPNGIGAGTTELNVFRSDYVHPLYGLFFFKSDDFISQCIGTFNGVVGQQRVSTKIIADIAFPLPPQSEQKRIINKINELFQILDNISAEL